MRYQPSAKQRRGSARRRAGSRGTSTASRRAAPARPPRPALDDARPCRRDAAPGRRRRGARSPPRRRAAAGPSSPGGCRIAGEVGDHDPAGLGLPPVVVDRQAERLQAPDDGLGVERLADAGDEPQRRQVVRAGERRRRPASASGSRSAPCTRRVTRCSLEDPVPALGVEVALVDDAGHAVGERGDDPVRRAGDPAGVGGAPEDVVGVQVERERPVAWWATTASWTCTRPSGVPVVPLVKCSSAMSSGSVGGISKSVGRAAISIVRSAHASPSALARRRRRAARARGRAAGRAAGATLRRYSAGVVTSTRPSPSASRWRTGSGPKAENSGHSDAARSSSVPSTATYSSGTRPSSVNTRSPGADAERREHVGEAAGRRRVRRR